MKPKIPQELRNAREWDPQFSGEKSSDDEDDEDDDDRGVDGDDESLAELVARTARAKSEKGVFPKKGMRPLATKSRQSRAKENVSSASDSPGFQLVTYKNNRRPGDRSRSSVGNGPDNGTATKTAVQVTRKEAAPKGPLDSKPKIRNATDSPLKRAILSHLKINAPSRQNTPAKATDPTIERSEYTHVIPKGTLEHVKRQEWHDLSEHINRASRCLVTLPNSGSAHEFKIHGTNNQITQARRILTEWLNSRKENAANAQRKGKGSFPKEASTASDKYLDKMKHEERQAKLKLFQGAPRSDVMCCYVGNYEWPLEDISPRDVFGPALEALDSLRSQLQCFIVYNERTNQMKLFSNKEGSIDEALKRLQNASHSITVRAKPALRVCLVAPQSTNYLVRFMPGHHDTHKTLVPLLIDQSDLLEDPEYRSHKIEENQPMDGFAESLEKGIVRFKYYSGELSMRISFGTFHLLAFKKVWITQTMNAQQFKDILNQPGTLGTLVARRAYTASPFEIWRLISRHTQFLIPANPSFSKLDDVRPEISASFYVHRLGKASAVLNVRYEKAFGNENPYEEVYRQWSKDDSSALAIIFDLTAISSQKEHSWSLIVEHHKPLETFKIDPQMHEFADSVSVRGDVVASLDVNGRPKLSWASLGAVDIQPSSLEQTTIYSHHLRRNSLWTLKFSYHEYYDAPFRKPHKADWSVALHCSTWDGILSEHFSLGIGEVSEKSADMSSFFPGRDNSCIEGQDIEELFVMVNIAKDILRGLESTSTTLL